LELVYSVAVEAIARVRARVRPVADVQADLEGARRAEALLRDELRPEPGARVAAEVIRRGPDGDADLCQDGEADPLLHAREAELAVERERLDALRVEARDVVRVAGRTDVVRRIAAHQDDGHGD